MQRREMTFLLTSSLAFNILLSVARGDISGYDECRDANCSTCADVRLSATCSDDWPLDDDRSGFSSTPRQCRAFCDDFDHSQYDYYAISSNCTYCQKQEAYDLYSLHEDEYTEDGEPQYCVPRQKCIDECGPELDGCIYTGTCGSQICFEGAISGKPALRKLVTFDGPGTVLRVDNTPGSGNGTFYTTDQEIPDEVPYMLKHGFDYCAGLRAGFRADASYYCESDEPLGDPRFRASTDNRQCRSMCEEFDRSEYEVVRISTYCNYCNTADAEDYVEDDGGDVHICIPQSKCRSKCGQEPEGCVYSGSCRSLFCFSGLNSRRAATLILTNDTGSSSRIVGNNLGDPTSLDPPVFGEYQPGATLSPEPSMDPPPESSPGQGSDPPPGSSPAATNSPLPSKTPFRSPLPSPSPNDDDDGGTSIWVWLGPVIGITGLIALVGAAMFGLMGGGRRNGGAGGVTDELTVANTFPQQP